MKKYDIAFLLALLLVMIAAFIATLAYPPKARLFPFIVIGISVILLITELTRLFFSVRDSGLENTPAAVMKDVKPADNTQKKSVLVPLGWVAGLALMIWVFGYIIALPLFTFIYLRMHGQKWRWAALLPVAMFVIVYVGFDILLSVPLYEGLLFQA